MMDVCNENDSCSTGTDGFYNEMHNRSRLGTDSIWWHGAGRRDTPLATGAGMSLLTDFKCHYWLTSNVIVNTPFAAGFCQTRLCCVSQGIRRSWIFHSKSWIFHSKSWIFHSKWWISLINFNKEPNIFAMGGQFTVRFSILIWWFHNRNQDLIRLNDWWFCYKKEFSLIRLNLPP